MKRVIALGFFDGVHVGHGALLNKTKERAAEISARPTVMSFDVHPDTLVFHVEVPLLSDPAGRREIIRRCFDIEEVVFIHFSRSVMEMPWKEFADTVIAEMDAAWLVCGYDFTFGRRGEGTAEKLKAYCEERGIGCDIISAVTVDGSTVSSTLIRELVAAGKMEKAAALLGHPHCINGVVRSGYHIGQKDESSIIHMLLPTGVIAPRFGVYATKVVLEDGIEHYAVTNVGVRPTFGEGNPVTVESHLLDGEDNLFEVPARVDFYAFLRDETKFESEAELDAQIQKDINRTKEYFA